ncbi:hypothetical protein C0991_001195 [Blastosporella zonata]|nr:hypothetical protein C0991_001195 [Blastosporella zonata]
MASFLQQVLKGLTPPPHVNLVDYDGVQFKWSIFVFRPARRYSLFNAYLPLLEKQFSKPLGRNGLTKDGNSDFYIFSTGRRNVASLHTVFTLRPRHDPFQYLFQFARTLVDLHYRPKDDVTLDFKLAPNALSQEFVWAIVAKDELLSIKNGRWDLVQLSFYYQCPRDANVISRHSQRQPSYPLCPLRSPLCLACVSLCIYLHHSDVPTHIEFADVTDNILKPALVAALRDPKILPYFRSLSVTDQPRDRPEGPLPANKRQKHVILSLSLPPGAQDASTLVSALFPFIDSLNNINLRPETKLKLKKTREELDKTLKVDSEREKKEEQTQAAEDKKAEKRKLEQDRIAKLPAAEQQKILEKERKRNLRKSQGKMARK